VALSRATIDRTGVPLAPANPARGPRPAGLSVRAQARARRQDGPVVLPGLERTAAYLEAKQPYLAYHTPTRLQTITRPLP
jgi:hypothetical protein